jgi:hypothetical protein
VRCGIGSCGGSARLSRESMSRRPDALPPPRPAPRQALHVGYALGAGSKSGRSPFLFVGCVWVADARVVKPIPNRGASALRQRAACSGAATDEVA